MKFRDYRFPVFCITASMFTAWLVGIVAVMCYCLATPDILSGVDPALSLIAGFGIGAVTSFFTMGLTLMIQFWFRKSGPTEAK